MSAELMIEALQAKLREMGDQDLAPVDVAVLDSGVDATHPDLQGRIAGMAKVVGEGKDTKAEEVPLGTNNDAFGHGTAVASIIARMAPNARIHDMRVLGEGNVGAGDLLVEGLRVAVMAERPIINMSLAATAKVSQQVFRLCEMAYRKNCLIVAAKRNVPFGDLGFPAEFSSTVSVDNKSFPSPYDIAYQLGSVIEYAAHGEEVPVAAAGGGYTTMTGTSFATPTISGICALIKGVYPDLRPFEMKTLLKGFAVPAD
ncbi:MAG: hypothetical protein D6E12_09260 [Desulfovibrio sp.]|mgnify:CR=1 FL=1|nr:MAG: hypothetical protein D6E12_09260 [Desulfovibrio sp.]